MATPRALSPEIQAFPRRAIALTFANKFPVSHYRKSKVIGFAAIILVLLGVVALVRLSPDCSSTSRQADKARALSEDQFTKLHEAMTALVMSFPMEDRIIPHQYTGKSIPRDFLDLSPVLIRLGDSPLIRLEGCYDEHLDLRFFSVGEPDDVGDHSLRIVLVSGDYDMPKEILWQQKQQANKAEMATPRKPSD